MLINSFSGNLFGMISVQAFENDLKMENFNKQLNSKRKEFLNNSQGGKYLNSDGQSNQNSVMEQSIGLAHRNLSSVYGRVKQKFNQNMGLII